MFHTKGARLYRKPHLLGPTHRTPGKSISFHRRLSVRKRSACVCSACLCGLGAPFRRRWMDSPGWVTQAFVAYNVLPAVPAVVSSQELGEDFISLCSEDRHWGHNMSSFPKFGRGGLQSNRIQYCLREFELVSGSPGPLKTQQPGENTRLRKLTRTSGQWLRLS